MESITATGFYRKNTRGRAYFMIRGAGGLRILRSSAKWPAVNGARVRATGVISRGWFYASAVTPEPRISRRAGGFPRSGARAA
jgi:hypothetical protein